MSRHVQIPETPQPPIIVCYRCGGPRTDKEKRLCRTCRSGGSTKRLTAEYPPGGHWRPGAIERLDLEVSRHQGPAGGQAAPCGGRRQGERHERPLGGGFWDRGRLVKAQEIGRIASHWAAFQRDLERRIRYSKYGRVLTAKEKGVLQGRYALDGGPFKEIHELAFGVTGEAIRQTETRALKILGLSRANVPPLPRAKSRKKRKRAEKPASSARART
ncbi:MAG TPA: hypothetical protein VI756_10680 [Blastocatellia bacterium]